ncbi:hypothetical protein [Burkholderia perseverans]|uniref:hypothetical protein n=1 Tax=Burkholderia perseverans TaxID=2615214 RepID=UPI001FED3F45|nr:hypothetical protein [Burkholderia perseverans]
MEQVGFYKNSLSLRNFLAGNPALLSDFRKNPVKTIRENVLDFSIDQDGEQIMLSHYLESVSDTARRVIVSSIMGPISPDVSRGQRAAGDDTGDDWIDDVHGGIAVTAVAVANVITVVNANVVANANATANVNAISNANAISNSNSLGFGSANSDGDAAGSIQIHLGENVSSTKLTDTLQDRGLNVYRRAALLKHLAWKYRPLEAHGGERTTVLAQYKNLKIELTVARDSNKWQLLKADLLQ